jgi:hypothetical protein
MDTRDILIGLLTLVLLIWFVYVMAFVVRKLLEKRGEIEHELDENRR